MCLSQIIKIVLVMLISGIVLSEKHPHPFPIAPSAPKSKKCDLPSSRKKKSNLPQSPSPQKSNDPSLWYSCF